jgi:hypothetical protein
VRQNLCVLHFTNCSIRPRTKQTAKKTAGAPAPLISLSDLQPPQPAKKRKINVEESSTTVLNGVNKVEVEVVCRGGRVEPGMASNSTHRIYN